MQEVLSPTPDGEYVGSAVVQEVFNIGGTGNIAGSKCRDGIIKKGSNVRVMRGDKILTESKVRTLRNFKVCSISGIFSSIDFYCSIDHSLLLLFIPRLKLTPFHLEMNAVSGYWASKISNLETLLKVMLLNKHCYQIKMS